ncbi:hypothetical protein Btru_000269 [Bulinus truncatus]|nr:hypothetical protein Btru_000269 [Bulinus truncatus]
MNVSKMSAGPGGPGMQPPREQSKRLQQTQAQVDEVVDIMRVNVEKVLDRDQKISQLDDRAEALQAGASQFEASAGKLKRKYWWKNCKMWLILIAVIVVIIIIIVVWVVTSTGTENFLSLLLFDYFSKQLVSRHCQQNGFSPKRAKYNCFFNKLWANHF